MRIIFPNEKTKRMADDKQRLDRFTGYYFDAVGCDSILQRADMNQERDREDVVSHIEAAVTNIRERDEADSEVDPELEEVENKLNMIKIRLEAANAEGNAVDSAVLVDIRRSIF